MMIERACWNSGSRGTFSSYRDDATLGRKHETAFVNWVYGVRFCISSEPFSLGNASCNPGRSGRFRQCCDPGQRRTWTWLGPSRRSGPSLWMGPRPPLWLATSSPLVTSNVLPTLGGGSKKRLQRWGNRWSRWGSWPSDLLSRSSPTRSLQDARFFLFRRNERAKKGDGWKQKPGLHGRR